MEAIMALDLLRESTRRIISGETEVSVAYSGGLDSSVVAAIAGESASVRCYTCAVEGSFDSRHAQQRAESESLELTIIELGEKELRSAVQESGAILGTSNPTQLAYTIPIITVLKGSRERLVLAGNGADELFGGYAKYASLQDAALSMAKDLEKMLRESERLGAAARRMGKEIGFPFVSRELIDFSRALPLERKITQSARKILLREVAGQLGLPSQNLPKKAAQYSSGALKEMGRLAKRDRKPLAEWTKLCVETGGRSS